MPPSERSTPRHLYGMSNSDTLWWDRSINGTQEHCWNVHRLFSNPLCTSGQFYLSLTVRIYCRLMPWVCRFATVKNKVSICSTTLPPTTPLGESPNPDRTRANADILLSHQAIVPTKAWQRHGYHHLGLEPLNDLSLLNISLGCQDDWNSLDHFDPTTDVRRLLKQFPDLRAHYRSLNNGLSLVQHGNWTHQDSLPFSNDSVTEGSVECFQGGLAALQNSNFTLNDTVWLMYTNQNATKTHGGNCLSPDGISGPYQSTTIVRNLIYPFENYTLDASDRPFHFDGKKPLFGCIESITLQPYDFRTLVPSGSRVLPTPTLTKFTPGHDA